MSQADVSCDSAQFTDLWSRVTKRFYPKITPEERGREQQQMPGTHTPPQPAPLASLRDLQSPIRRGCSSRFPGLNNADSPGDTEPSQDIFWDSTSPTQAHTGSGLRRTRTVEISDIVNRIAPKDVKGKGTESPLLQWISDSAVPCTPEIPVPRVRKRSTRQSSVEDLMKLARQFDKNMQRDTETSEQLHTVNTASAECATPAKTKTPELSSCSGAKDPKDQAEAELHALFDCSTQKVSGPLSQSSAASARSQETKNKSASGLRQSLTLGSDESAAKPAGGKGSCSFDDDWENDDLLLNDSFVLAMTQNPEQNQDADTNATLQTNPPRVTPSVKPDANRPSSLTPGTRCSVLQELCPKPKTTIRSTFKLQSNPHFLLKLSTREITQTQSQKSDQKAKTTTTPPADEIAEDQKAAPTAVNSSQDLWEDGDDDALLYQVCDTVERISNSQPQQVSPCQEKGDISGDRQRKTTAPLPIEKTACTGAGASYGSGSGQRSPRAFLRSNSLPGTGCQTANLQGWTIPMKGANSKCRMSQSLPGSRGSLGAFSECKGSTGSFQAGEVKPHAVTAREAQGSGSQHTAFKRHVSESAVSSNKVFVTSQMTGSKCSAAEIERKKQEALARRRLRLQNAPKP